MILTQHHSVKADGSAAPFPADEVVRLVEELRAAYAGFTWESALWAESGHRRSPYRTLVLFGLSARTRDSLLVDMCGRFFRRYPKDADLAARTGETGEAVGDIVRAGQIPIVESMARALSDGVPRHLDGLMGIKGVGEKIAECVMAYGWGEDALPLDANCVRVLDRVLKLNWGRNPPAPLRQSLKCVYLKHRRRFSESSTGMVDIHEILRLHGQVCCTRTPDCARCPVSSCASRRQPQGKGGGPTFSIGLWDEWRELINEPSAV